MAMTMTMLCIYYVMHYDVINLLCVVYYGERERTEK